MQINKNTVYYVAFGIALLAHQSHFIPYIDYPVYDKMMVVALTIFVWACNREDDSERVKAVKAVILSLFVAKAFKHIFGNPYEWEVVDYWFAFLACLISYFEYRGWHKLITIRINRWLNKSRFVKK